MPEGAVSPVVPLNSLPTSTFRVGRVGGELPLADAPPVPTSTLTPTAPALVVPDLDVPD